MVVQEDREKREESGKQCWRNA